MITVKEFKNIFSHNYVIDPEIEITFFIEENNDPNHIVILDLLSFEPKSDTLKDNIIYHYILKEVPETIILNSLKSINDIFIDGKNEYDLIDFSFIKENGEEVNLEIKDFNKFIKPTCEGYIDVQFNEI